MLQERDNQLDIVPVDRQEKSKNNQSEPNVEMEKVSGKWNAQETELTLDNIDIEAKSGKLLAIIGTVGAGKSSIIQAILGEFPSTKGKITVRGKLSYSPQESWVFSGSIKQNILFGMDFNEKRYDQVIEACALKHDLTQWEFGDRTLVGERGVSLSGGQKARVSLARAIYRDADTYLLDDPLSAVDVHVGRHLFNNCIKGFLKDKAVILVTHQLQYLQDADTIMVMKSGKVEDSGTFQHLQKNGMDFSAFLAEEEDEKEDEEESKKPTIMRNRTISIVSETVSEMSHNNIHNGIKRIIEEEVEDPENNKEKELKDDPKQVKEQRSSGSVKASIYTKYFTSGSGWIGFIFMITMNILTQALYSGSDIWLAYWTSKEELKIIHFNSTAEDVLALPAPSITSTDNVTIVRDNWEEDFVSEHFYNLGIYAAIVLTLAASSMIRTVHFFYACMRSSVKLHNSMFNRLLRAPCRFFDTNPVGKTNFLMKSILQEN